ncbi:MAG: HEPN domain-containing protein [Thermosphaera sp.]|nr:HEPN domain-containing protein [Thermosphaera sp.]
MKGIKLPIEWVEKAEVFLRNARRNYDEGVYWLTCFSAHQGVELYLKSLIVALTGIHPYTHDLVELLDAVRAVGIEVSSEVSLACELLTPHYTLARYPGKRVYSYTSERGRLCVEYAEKVVEWVRKTADP